mgnify:FL=1
MLHILTIHFKDKWVDIQKRELKKYISEDYKVYTRLGENYEKHKDKFDGAIEGQGHWTESMGLLLKFINENAKVGDKVLLIDSDAFPIAPISEFMEYALSQAEFVSCQEPKHEWDDDYKIPHPMFMLFDAKHILEGNLSDYLSKIIKDQSGNWWGGAMQWIKENNYREGVLIRSNKINLHPLYFGIYNNLIYHHWAGSRKMITRRDRLANNQNVFLKAPKELLGIFRFKDTNTQKEYLISTCGGIENTSDEGVKFYANKYQALNQLEESSFKLIKGEKYSISELTNGILITSQDYDEANLDKTAEINHKMSNDIFEQITHQCETIMDYLMGNYEGETE